MSLRWARFDVEEGVQSPERGERGNLRFNHRHAWRSASVTRRSPLSRNPRVREAERSQTRPDCAILQTRYARFALLERFHSLYAEAHRAQVLIHPPHAQLHRKRVLEPRWPDLASLEGTGQRNGITLRVEAPQASTSYDVRMSPNGAGPRESVE